MAYQTILTMVADVLAVQGARASAAMVLVLFAGIFRLWVQGPVSIWRLSLQVWDFHDREKTVVRPSYLYYGVSYTG